MLTYEEANNKRLGNVYHHHHHHHHVFIYDNTNINYMFFISI
jgi:hypothetical protein